MFILSIGEKFIFLLLVVGFFTLLERKILGYVQIRKGPNKVSVVGILQPILDAMKLFLKSKMKSTSFLKAGFVISSVSSLFLVLILWVTSPAPYGVYHLKLSILIIFCISSTAVYTVFGSGWFSVSKYAFVGSIRAVAQMISYEVTLIFVFLFFVLAASSSELKETGQITHPPLISIFWALVPLWVIITVAETNRAPFDFAEGESEIVSGFNIEYGSFEFALLFMSEYLSILFFSLLGNFFLLGLNSGSSAFLICLGVWSSVIILVRGAYPRMRYDRLMELSWKTLLFLVMAFPILFSIFTLY